DIIRGTYSFFAFVSSIYLPIVLLLNFLVLAGRWFISRNLTAGAKSTSEAITLSGDGRKDLLQLSPDQLVYAVSAQNYVEVHYLVDGTLKKHLLRTTLKKVEQQTPVLRRIHRSHLINPLHFRRWTGPNSLEVYAVEVPVSKQYRAALEKVLG
ncbi:MAG: LytTR family DNA-binding domain-containing protein, partial [Bacteroidota bacterium]